MKILLTLALAALIVLPGCVYYGGGGYGRGYYADHPSHHHHHGRYKRDRW